MSDWNFDYNGRSVVEKSFFYGKSDIGPDHTDTIWRSSGYRDGAFPSYAILSGRHGQVAGTWEISAVDVVLVGRAIARPLRRGRSNRTNDSGIKGVGMQIVQARETGEAVQQIIVSGIII